MNKKLLYVINHIDWFWSHRLPLAQAAQNAGWDVHLAVTDADKDEQLKSYGFTGHDLPKSDQGFLPFTILKTILSIRKLILKEKPDLVHDITIKYAFITGLAARFCPNQNTVFTLAGLGYLFSGEGFKPKLLRAAIGPLLKFALKHKHAQIIFQNPDDMNLMIKRGFARPEQCHLILGSGVDTQSFKATALPQTDRPIVLMPTRLVHDKGIAIFIEAAKHVHKENPNIRFQIAGGITRNNPLAITENEMNAMIKDSPVEWLGKVSDMPALLEQTTLICYPSYYGEGIPKVLLEANACARPIITTDHPGCREAVKHGENGLLVAVKDAAQTAKAVLELMNKDSAELQKMANAARALAEKQFDVDLINEATIKTYDSAL